MVTGALCSVWQSAGQYRLAAVVSVHTQFFSAV